MNYHDHQNLLIIVKKNILASPFDLDSAKFLVET